MTNIAEVSPSEAHEASKDGSSLLIDVRESNEFEEVHASNAKLHPLSEIDVEALAEKYQLTETTEFFIICRSGVRSMRAAEAFYEAGYKRPINVAGGTLAWIESGLPTG